MLHIIRLKVAKACCLCELGGDSAYADYDGDSFELVARGGDEMDHLGFCDCSYYTYRYMKPACTFVVSSVESLEWKD